VDPVGDPFPPQPAQLVPPRCRNLEPSLPELKLMMLRGMPLSNARRECMASTKILSHVKPVVEHSAMRTSEHRVAVRSPAGRTKHDTMPRGEYEAAYHHRPIIKNAQGKGMNGTMPGQSGVPPGHGDVPLPATMKVPYPLFRILRSLLFLYSLPPGKHNPPHVSAHKLG